MCIRDSIYQAYAPADWILKRKKGLCNMKNRKQLQRLIMPLLAALFIGAAGAVQESEQVLLDGDKASFEPVSTEPVSYTHLYSWISRWAA